VDVHSPDGKESKRLRVANLANDYYALSEMTPAGNIVATTHLWGGPMEIPFGNKSVEQTCSTETQVGKFAPIPTIVAEAPHIIACVGVFEDNVLFSTINTDDQDIEDYMLFTARHDLYSFNTKTWGMRLCGAIHSPRFVVVGNNMFSVFNRRLFYYSIEQKDALKITCVNFINLDAEPDGPGYYHLAVTGETLLLKWKSGAEVAAGDISATEQQPQ
jgi:hypothetical protein